MTKVLNNDKLIIGKNSPTELKLSYWFWMELGRPPKFHNSKTLVSWSRSMVSLMKQSGLDYEHLKWFLTWACRLRDANGADYGNDFTARNLRVARDPMASLVKQFPRTYHDFFLPKVDKIIPMLMEVRQREDELKAQEKPVFVKSGGEGPLKHIDLLAIRMNDKEGPYANLDKEEVENMRMSLEWLDMLDAAFPLIEPLPGETEDELVEREFQKFGDHWRCEDCTYGFSIDGDDDLRVKLCPDCDEERKMYEDEDKEWMDGEAPSISCLTREWD